MENIILYIPVLVYKGTALTLFGCGSSLYLYSCRVAQLPLDVGITLCSSIRVLQAFVVSKHTLQDNLFSTDG